MKLVINKCFGGFGLSQRGIRRWCELKGRPCFFFSHKRNASGNLMLGKFAPSTDETDSYVFTFDIPNPDEVIPSSDNWRTMTAEQRAESNRLWSQHSISACDIPRDDPDLVRVVEELGEEANGSCSKLSVVVIPDGVEWTVEEYDGNEHVAERHETWR